MKDIVFIYKCNDCGKEWVFDNNNIHIVDECDCYLEPSNSEKKKMHLINEDSLIVELEDKVVTDIK